MNRKNFISFFLTGLFLMNLFSANATSLIQAWTGEEISIVNPFCKKTGDSKSNSKSEITDFETVQSIQISAVCTTAFDIKNPNFTVNFEEDNFKNHSFTDSFRSDLFSVNFYTPPRA